MNIKQQPMKNPQKKTIFFIALTFLFVNYLFSHWDCFKEGLGI